MNNYDAVGQSEVNLCKRDYFPAYTRFLDISASC